LAQLAGRRSATLKIGSKYATFRTFAVEGVAQY
jgi:hypothetical protein